MAAAEPSARDQKPDHATRGRPAPLPLAANRQLATPPFPAPGANQGGHRLPEAGQPAAQLWPARAQGAAAAAAPSGGGCHPPPCAAFLPSPLRPQLGQLCSWAGGMVSVLRWLPQHVLLPFCCRLVPLLPQLITLETVPVEVRQAAAVNFKNFVKYHWVRGGGLGACAAGMWGSARPQARVGEHPTGCRWGLRGGLGRNGRCGCSSCCRAGATRSGWAGCGALCHPRPREGGQAAQALCRPWKRVQPADGCAMARAASRRAPLQGV